VEERRSGAAKFQNCSAVAGKLRPPAADPPAASRADESKDPELAELQRDLAPERVLDVMEEHQRNSA